MEYEILHDKKAMKFYTEIDGEQAFLRYLPTGEGTLDFIKTFVPPAGRGKGLAALLMQAGLDYARETGARIRPSCSYVAKYFQDHPEVSSLREQD